MTGKSFEVFNGIFCVGGPELSHPQDALAYLVMGQESSALIDAGSGKGSIAIWENISSLGQEPQQLTYLVLTHAHVDHIGGAAFIKEKTGCRIVAHQGDQEATESGDPSMTAASWYGVNLPRLEVDVVLKEHIEALPLGPSERLFCLHTPGHTPGSISPYLDRQGKRVLFGQDIHGPFSKAFGSNLSDWNHSMMELLALKADILCEGHFGIYRTRPKVQAYIEQYIRQYS